MLNRGAEVNAKHKSGATPLFAASQNGHLDVVNRLLNHPDADVDVRNHGQRTALIIAAGLNNVAIANTFSTAMKSFEKIPTRSLARLAI